MKEILEKLSKIQAKLKAPKNQYNKFGNYNYRSCEDILEAVKPLAAEFGCTLTVGDKLEYIGERYYVTATATLYDTETGQNITNTASAREEETKKGMDSSQITGTASSYARKYALNGLFCIDDTKDADTNEFKNQQSNVPGPVKCPKCGKLVKGFTRPDGTAASPEDVLENLGMCIPCSKAGK